MNAKTRRARWAVPVGGLAVLAGIALAIGLIHFGGSTRQSPEATEAQIRAGEALFARNCSPCHGANGAGQNPAEPNGGYDDQGRYIAPALDATAHAWHHPDEVLFSWIRNGSEAKDSPMRGWEGRMTDDEIWSVIAYFKSLWAEKQRAVQRERSLK
jgi:mono/diheme cytochrome c family protein